MPKAPVCKSCGKPLRRFKYRAEGPQPFMNVDIIKQWGDYGDNLFCGQRCGYDWAVWHWRKQAER